MDAMTPGARTLALATPLVERSVTALVHSMTPHLESEGAGVGTIETEVLISDDGQLAARGGYEGGPAGVFQTTVWLPDWWAERTYDEPASRKGMVGDHLIGRVWRVEDGPLVVAALTWVPDVVEMALITFRYAFLARHDGVTPSLDFEGPPLAYADQRRRYGAPYPSS